MLSADFAPSACSDSSEDSPAKQKAAKAKAQKAEATKAAGVSPYAHAAHAEGVGCIHIDARSHVYHTRTRARAHTHTHTHTHTNV